MLEKNVISSFFGETKVTKTIDKIRPLYSKKIKYAEHLRELGFLISYIHVHTFKRTPT